MRIAVVFDTPYAKWTPDDYWARMELETSPDFEGEAESAYQVARALVERGHQVVLAGAHQSPDEVTEVLRRWGPDVVFNLAEGFIAQDRFDFVLPAALEMEGHPYTGAGPQALMVTRNKAMTKKILAHQGLSVPRFFAVRQGENPPRKSEQFFPAIVKPLSLDGSAGISQSSVVHDSEQLLKRVRYIHDRLGDAAIVEEFIDGRELYVAVLGNGRQARCLPPMELVFEKATRPEQRIATRTSKWDPDYCVARGIELQDAKGVTAELSAELNRTCLAAYRALWLRDYARFDLRLDAQGRIWIIEANANPYLSVGHEAAEAARRAGMDFGAFVERIAKVAARRHRRARRRQRAA